MNITIKAFSFACFFCLQIFSLFAQTESEPVNKEPSPDRFYSEFLHMLLVLGFILVLLMAVTWFLKKTLNSRVQQINATSPIKILERRALSPKTAIYVVEIYGKHFAIAESPHGLASLGELRASGRSFSEVMDKQGE